MKTLASLFCAAVLLFDVSEAQEYPSKSEILQFTQKDHYIGNFDAKVILIEYSSLSCPGCAFFHEEILPQIKQNYIDSGEVLYIFRDYPANEQGLYGAVLSQCFGDQYFEVLDILFKAQKSWAFRKDFKQTLGNIAKLSGLDISRANKCLDDKQMAHGILKKAYTSMKALDINSTPIFFVNGNKITGMRNDYEYFAKMLDKYMKK
jgi:protein-disulfide isomerase